jgi:hypothetical protein
VIEAMKEKDYNMERFNGVSIKVADYFAIIYWLGIR